MRPPIPSDPLIALLEDNHWVAFTHVLLHGSQHRARCLHFLHRLDVPAYLTGLPTLISTSAKHKRSESHEDET
jgi:hypothetical protein